MCTILHCVCTKFCTHTNFVHTQCKIVHTKIWSEVLFKLLFPVPPQMKLFVYSTTNYSSHYKYRYLDILFSPVSKSVSARSIGGLHEYRILPLSVRVRANVRKTYVKKAATLRLVAVYHGARLRVLLFGS